MTITNAYLTHNRPYTKRSKTTAIAIHWVANPGTSAMQNRNYFQNTSTEVSANYIVGLQGEVVCCIPDEEVSWCTNQANSYTVSIENCHPDWTGKFNSATYNSLVELTVKLCKKYRLDPMSRGVIRHFDVTGKDCPKWFVPKSRGGSDTENCEHWAQFLWDVKNKLTRSSSKPASKPASTNNKPTSSTSSKTPTSYKVKITADALNIRKGAGTQYPIVGCIKDHGVYTIIDTCNKWGFLKSKAGWICLDYVKKL